MLTMYYKKFQTWYPLKLSIDLALTNASLKNGFLFTVLLTIGTSIPDMQNHNEQVGLVTIGSSSKND